MPTIDSITPQPHLHAFAGYGIELEYMIVARDTLAALPVADRLLIGPDGEPVNEIQAGELAWSNELVMHVVEFKTNGPAPSLVPLAARFAEAVATVNRRLAPMGGMLLPTAMHPQFDPDSETRLWPHGQNEIYAAYDRIFQCRGHGWSNLQSMHINLPFFDDTEFVRLHAAIRAVLPLIPALAAASPLVEGRASGWMDSRLRYYRDNQRRIPEIAGRIVPEAVASIEDYEKRILEPMYRAVAAHDPDGVLAEDWLNSRGAIARFERQTIEIRIIDIQECPAADLAIAEAVVALVRWVYDDDGRLAAAQALSTGDLADQLFAAAHEGSAVRFDRVDWLALFDVDRPMSGAALWRELFGRIELSGAASGTLLEMIDRGSLAEAILARLGPAPTGEAIRACYRELATCLAEDRLFRS
jgi:glutamate---cysteine ligase / carboxylate-amine ligase